MKITEVITLAWSYRRAWWFTATSRTKERFARTALGSFWLGLSNLLSVGALASVYGTVFKVQDFRQYVVFLGLGLIIWNTIAGAIQSAPNLLKANAGNIKNTNLHPIFYTCEEWSFQVQTFFQSFALVILALSFFQHDLILNFITHGILPAINFLAFIYWFPIIICVLGAKYEDFYQLIPIVLQLMFLLTPILYQKSALGSIGWTAEINPIYIILNDMRNSIIGSDTINIHTLMIAIFNIAGIYISLKILERQRSRFPFIL